MDHHDFSLSELKQLDIVEYLEKLGFQPQKVSNNDYWYLSPLREEKEASFKVNRTLNLWYDHGLGKRRKYNRLWNIIPQLLDT